MAKLFNKIRKQLVAEKPSVSRTSNYLKYAIGEIVLVVIGILIALSINNWNENRKERLQETIILNQLRSEFDSNLKQLDQKITIRNEMMKASLQFLKLIDNPNLRNKDSIDILIAKTMPYATFDPIINDLSSSGELNLIKNTELKQALTRWTSNISDLREEEEIWKYYRNELYIPFLIKHYQFRTLRSKAFKSNVLGKYSIETSGFTQLYANDDIGVSKHPEDFNALLDHPDIEDHLSRCYSMNKWANVQSIILRKRIIEIIELLNSEINDQLL